MWRWAAASREGTSHKRTGNGRQDAMRVTVAGRWLIAIACDGAGSAARGRGGAVLATRSLSEAARAHLAHGDLPDDATVQRWVEAARERIAQTATARALAPRDFATTVVLLLTDGADSLVLHIGDGAAVARTADGWRALSWPEQGEYAATTYFLTDDTPRLRVARASAPADCVALFSDGLERLALDFASEQPHAPFFDGMIAPLAAGTAPGRDPKLSAQLGAFLDSERVNARTDDDKTLILALRG